MIMAPSAFFLVALVIWGAKTMQENMKIAAKAQQGGAK
jgi:Na+-transporting NADH:ubiquinone oxidoreductase subunit NqrD